MSHFFSVSNTAWTLFGTPMSWLELASVGFSLWSVYLMARHNILTWPTGAVAVVLSLLLLWQIQLYADVVEQIYYFVTGFWGWWLWIVKGGPTDRTIQQGTRPQILYALGVTGVLSLLAGWFDSNVHIWWPGFFKEAASLPYLDAATTVASFTAQWLMVKQRLECWWFWIIIDVVGVWLYAYKGVMLYSVQYAIFLVLAIGGLISWTRKRHAAALPTAP